MKLFRYYRNAVLYPTIFVLLFSAAYSVISNMYSNDFANYQAILMSVIPALLFSLLMCLLSLTIYLNRIRKVVSSTIMNILTWFLFPLLYVIIIFIQDLTARVRLDLGFGVDFLYLLFMTIPFIVGLVLTFVKFRQQIPANITA